MAPHVNQLTVRGLDPRLTAEIQKLARAKGISMNKAALSILARGAGLDLPATNERQIGRAIDRFVGIWTDVQARDFSRSTRSLEQVDEDFWK
jgi:hypothetical protein